MELEPEDQLHCDECGCEIVKQISDYENFYLPIKDECLECGWKFEVGKTDDGLFQVDAL